MSTRKEQQKYYPVDWEPSMGSLDAYHGTHPLRKRAKKLYTEGILIVRFELPFNCWCTWCSKSISLGVRYNAAKKQIGTYLSSPVWEFSMPCHMCHGELIIHTDPENDTYVCIRGLQKKIQDFEVTGTEGLGHVDLIKTAYDKKHKEQMMVNPLYALEFQTRSKSRAALEERRLETLEEIQADQGDSVRMSRTIRAHLRTNRHEEHATRKAMTEQISATGFAIPLVHSTEEDELELRSAPFHFQKISKSVRQPFSSSLPRSSGSTTAVPKMIPLNLSHVPVCSIDLTQEDTDNVYVETNNTVNIGKSGTEPEIGLKKIGSCQPPLSSQRILSLSNASSSSALTSSSSSSSSFPPLKHIPLIPGLADYSSESSESEGEPS